MLPASKAEVTAVQQGFQELKAHVTAEVNGLKEVDREIVAVLRELKDAVAEPRNGSQQNAPRARLTAPARPKPAQPKSPILGLFDF